MEGLHAKIEIAHETLARGCKQHQANGSFFHLTPRL